MSRVALYFLIFLTLTATLTERAFAERPAYVLLKPDGTRVPYSELLNSARNQDLIFFGELHNNAIAHWLQYELGRDLILDQSRRTHLGLEMFEADQQLLIEEYLSGLISQSSFESEARLWNNYQTDYKRLFEFARNEGATIVATNIPRRYASSVFRGGLGVLEELSSTAKRWMAPLPIEVDLTLPGYAGIQEAAGGHGGPNLVYAQAVKDATMAHFILLHMKLDDQMLHLNGSYHSNNREGIIWYIEEMVSGYRIFTINTIEAEDLENVDPERLQAADITLVVPERMTRTY